MIPEPEPRRRGGRPHQRYAKDDPRYQPTQADLEEDVSIQDMTAEDVARIMFAGVEPFGQRQRGAS